GESRTPRARRYCEVTMLELRSLRIPGLLCAGALLAIAAASPARADEIRLKAGKTIGPDVEVLDESYEFVTYKILGSQQQEPADNVVEVVYTRGPAGLRDAVREC